MCLNSPHDHVVSRVNLRLQQSDQRVGLHACVAGSLLEFQAWGTGHEEDWRSVSSPSTKSLQFNSQDNHWIAEILVPVVMLRLPGHHGVVPGQRVPLSHH